MRRKFRYKHSFDRFLLNNRWRQPDYSRDGSWVIFGFGISYFSPREYEYYFNLFGLRFRFWMKRELIENET